MVRFGFLALLCTSLFSNNFASLTTYIDGLSSNKNFSGSTLITKDNATIYSSSVGKASIGFNIDNTLLTPFDLGSVSFFFPTLALLQLIEDGKAHFTDPLSNFISSSSFPNLDLEKITLLHLLTRSSGVDESLSEGWQKKNNGDFTTLEDYENIARNSQQHLKPGNTWHPSETEGILLGIVIEKITKKPFYEFMNNIFIPSLQLQNTRYPLLTIPTYIATGYCVNENIKNNLFYRVARGSPGTGIYSTAEDITQCIHSLFDYKIVSKRMVKRIFTPYIKIAHPVISSAIASPYTLQGLGITLVYNDAELATDNRRIIQALSYGVLHPSGIPLSSLKGYIATLSSSSKYLSTAIDIYNNGRTISCVLSNYGHTPLRNEFPPATIVQGKIRRMLKYSE